MRRVRSHHTPAGLSASERFGDSCPQGPAGGRKKSPQCSGVHRLTSCLEMLKRAEIAASPDSPTPEGIQFIIADRLYQAKRDSSRRRGRPRVGRTPTRNALWAHVLSAIRPGTRAIWRAGCCEKNNTPRMSGSCFRTSSSTTRDARVANDQGVRRTREPSDLTRDVVTCRHCAEAPGPGGEPPEPRQPIQS